MGCVLSHLLAALEQAGKDLDRLTPEYLAPIDEFHIRGRVATLEQRRNLEEGRIALAQVIATT